ncbi:predicted protein [Postia placenta Mad-698-R]|nr:predicted protein [Postia placenta Mad-698-R]
MDDHTPPGDTHGGHVEHAYAVSPPHFAFDDAFSDADDAEERLEFSPEAIREDIAKTFTNLDKHVAQDEAEDFARKIGRAVARVRHGQLHERGRCGARGAAHRDGQLQAGGWCAWMGVLQWKPPAGMRIHMEIYLGAMRARDVWEATGVYLCDTGVLFATRNMKTVQRSRDRAHCKGIRNIAGVIERTQGTQKHRNMTPRQGERDGKQIPLCDIVLAWKLASNLYDVLPLCHRTGPGSAKHTKILLASAFAPEHNAHGYTAMPHKCPPCLLRVAKTTGIRLCGRAWHGFCDRRRTDRQTCTTARHKQDGGMLDERVRERRVALREGKAAASRTGMHVCVVSLSSRVLTQTHFSLRNVASTGHPTFSSRVGIKERTPGSCAGLARVPSDHGKAGETGAWEKCTHTWDCDLVIAESKQRRQQRTEDGARGGDIMTGPHLVWILARSVAFPQVFDHAATVSRDTARARARLTEGRHDARDRTRRTITAKREQQKRTRMRVCDLAAAEPTPRRAERGEDITRGTRLVAFPCACDSAATVLRFERRVSAPLRRNGTPAASIVKPTDGAAMQGGLGVSSRYAILPHPSAGPCIECANPGFAADAVLTRIRRRRVRVCLGALPRGVPADACMPAVRLSFFFFSRSVPARGAVPLDVGLVRARHDDTGTAGELSAERVTDEERGPVGHNSDRECMCEGSALSRMAMRRSRDDQMVRASAETSSGCTRTLHVPMNAPPERPVPSVSSNGCGRGTSMCDPPGVWVGSRARLCRAAHPCLLCARRAQRGLQYRASCSVRARYAVSALRTRGSRVTAHDDTLPAGVRVSRRAAVNVVGKADTRGSAAHRWSVTRGIRDARLAGHALVLAIAVDAGRVELARAIIESRPSRARTACSGGESKVDALTGGMTKATSVRKAVGGHARRPRASVTLQRASGARLLTIREMRWVDGRARLQMRREPAQDRRAEPWT